MGFAGPDAAALFDGITDDLLVKIFQECGVELAPILRLVCRRWHGLCSDEVRLEKHSHEQLRL